MEFVGNPNEEFPNVDNRKTKDVNERPALADQLAQSDRAPESETPAATVKIEVIEDDSLSEAAGQPDPQPTQPDVFDPFGLLEPISADTEPEPPVKRGRGRPRKHSDELRDAPVETRPEAASTDNPSNPIQSHLPLPNPSVKAVNRSPYMTRRRARPRSHSNEVEPTQPAVASPDDSSDTILSDPPLSNPSVQGQDHAPPVKRRRGRPRKYRRPRVEAEVNPTVSPLPGGFSSTGSQPPSPTTPEPNASLVQQDVQLTRKENAGIAISPPHNHPATCVCRPRSILVRRRTPKKVSFSNTPAIIGPLPEWYSSKMSPADSYDCLNALYESTHRMDGNLRSRKKVQTNKKKAFEEILGVVPEATEDVENIATRASPPRRSSRLNDNSNNTHMTRRTSPS